MTTCPSDPARHRTIINGRRLNVLHDTAAHRTHRRTSAALHVRVTAPDTCAPGHEAETPGHRSYCRLLSAPSRFNTIPSQKRQWSSAGLQYGPSRSELWSRQPWGACPHSFVPFSTCFGRESPNHFLAWAIFGVVEVIASVNGFRNVSQCAATSPTITTALLSKVSDVELDVLHAAPGSHPWKPDLNDTRNFPCCPEGD